MKQMAQGERGFALIMALAFMAITVPLVTAALGLASVLHVDSRIKGQMTREQYCATAGNEHGYYRLAYEPGYASSLQPGVANDYTIQCDGRTVAVSVLWDTDPEAAPSIIPSNLRASKTVYPETALPDTSTTFTYTITVTNVGSTPQSLNKIHDGLPAGFTYVASSTTGVTTFDPSITTHNVEAGTQDFLQLTWNLSDMNLILEPLEAVSLIFDAQASLPEGYYCNQTWADPGAQTTSSGFTAKITVGSPAGTQCEGEKVLLTKSVSPALTPSSAPLTVTYTITVWNNTTSTQKVVWVRDLLPADFVYVPNSTGGTFGASEPNINVHQGRTRLTWNISGASRDIPPGEQKTIVFQATATLAGGTYYNEAWAKVTNFTSQTYTWPTGEVTAMSVFKITSTYGGASVSSEVWFGTDSRNLTIWEHKR